MERYYYQIQPNLNWSLYPSFNRFAYIVYDRRFNEQIAVCPDVYSVEKVVSSLNQKDTK